MSGSASLRFTVVGLLPESRYTIADQAGGPSLEGTGLNRVLGGSLERSGFLVFRPSEDISCSAMYIALKIMCSGSIIATRSGRIGSAIS